VAGVTYTNADCGDYYCSMVGDVHYANSAYFTVWLSTALANEFWRSVTGLVGTDRDKKKGWLLLTFFLSSCYTPTTLPEGVPGRRLRESTTG